MKAASKSPRAAPKAHAKKTSMGRVRMVSGSNDGRIRRSARVDLADELGVIGNTEIARDGAQLGNVTLTHRAANKRADDARSHVRHAEVGSGASGGHFADLNLGHVRSPRLRAGVARQVLM